MIEILGRVSSGNQHFSKRMSKHYKKFTKLLGENIHLGTINVNVGARVAIIEHFRLKGSEIDEAHQDLIFEICRINQMWAYRVRPVNLLTGTGGHGDHILEIICTNKIPDIIEGAEVKIQLFR